MFDERPDGPPAVPADQAHAGADLLDQVSQELDAVEAALVRLDQGSFDTCELCGAAIGHERLLEDPLLTRCPAHA